MNKETKKRVFSGVQPSGVLHIGNYLGAISNWVKMQDDFDSIFCVVDYHAITVKQDPKKLSRQILDTAKVYLASGINPAKSIIFKQSDVSTHTELAWILNCITRNSDLMRMTQFKNKAGLQLLNFENILKRINNASQVEFYKKNKQFVHTKDLIKLADHVRYESLQLAKSLIEASLSSFNKVEVGLYDYPVLMAADILLYNTDAVPVGEDQKQHVELARDLAKRFNSQFGEVFKIPEAVIQKDSARIMGLDDPMKKMSKSAGAANYIALTDEINIAKKKIMRAVTDSGKEIKYDKTDKPAITNLLNIYSLLVKKSIKDIEKKYEGKGYGDFKKGLAEVVAEFLNQFQTKYNSFSDEEVKEILKEGAERARPMAENTLKSVKEKLGVS
jgi:tryptophanyl-tRNA synthetase